MTRSNKYQSNGDGSLPYDKLRQVQTLYLSFSVKLANAYFRALFYVINLARSKDLMLPRYKRNSTRYVKNAIFNKEPI